MTTLALTLTTFRKKLFSLMQNIQKQPIVFTYRGDEYSIISRGERIRLGLIDSNLKKMTREEIRKAIDAEKKY